MTREGIELEIVDSPEGLVALRAEWDDVQDACRHEHVFLDHRFMTAWWRFAAHGAAMHTLVLRRGGVTQGVVPLALSRGWEVFPTREKNVRIAADFQCLPAMRWRRVVPIRRLSFPLSLQSSNIRAHCLLRGDVPEAAEAVMRYCARIRDRWDVMSLDGIPEGSEQEAQLCDAAVRAGLRRGRSRHHRGLLFASLPDSMDAFLRQRSANFRSGMRRAWRQSVERTSDLGVFQIREFRGDVIDAGMDRLFELERQSWKAGSTREREIYLTLDDAHRAFYRDVARVFASADRAQVLITEVGGQPANGLYSLERQGVTTCLLTYQAEALAKRVSVAPLWSRFFELAIAQGVREVDFNGNNSYLERFATGETRFSRLVFYNDAFYSSVLRAAADGANLLAQTCSRA